ncbi:hypothetical protein cand_010300 [Cryptosporidium andersoni]|uniref:Tudor domain-containing protein n=1 Tax=Cryptosporidium andersoni TaxID=117008 RepID=A0A1J4MEX2_9CRYT|nr:hypothetical protein cand_010300 [Cryptosporidium andersoni]
MNELDESLDSLEEKRNYHIEQLKLVEYQLTISGNENNNILVKLRDDLIEIINLTSDLIRYKSSVELNKSTNISAIVPTNNENTNEVAKTEIHSNLPLTKSIKLEDSFDHTLPSIIDINEKSFNIGRTVELNSTDNYKKYARIESESGTGYKVRLFSSNKTIEISKGKVHLLPELTNLKKGDDAEALYSYDGCWYACKIKDVRQNGYLIEYSGYEEDDIVPFDRIRILKRSDKVLDNESKIPNIITPAGYKIPENLIIKPTDSEKVKFDKRRKMSAIKKQQRNDFIESRAIRRQDSWKKHINSVKKAPIFNKILPNYK